MTTFEARRIRKCETAAARRARLKARKLCISAASHGPATSGVLCADCRDTHNGQSPWLLKRAIREAAAQIVIDTSRRSA